MNMNWMCILLDMPEYGTKVLLYSKSTGIRSGKIEKHDKYHDFLVTFDGESEPISTLKLNVLFWTHMPRVPNEEQTNEAIMDHALEGSPLATRNGNMPHLY